MPASGQERRLRDVHDESGLSPTPERLRHRSEPTLRATSGNHAAQQIPSSARLIGVIGIVEFATSINLPPNADSDTASRRKLNIQGVISEPQASPMNDDR
jgi:hypothetical protein